MPPQGYAFGDLTMHASLKTSESDASSLLESIISSSSDAIVSKSLESVVTSWNKGAEYLFGYSADEIIGQSITLIIPSDRRSEEKEIIERIALGERIPPFETVRVKKSGENVDVSVTVSPIRDKQGKIVGASKIARDITEQVVARDRALQNERQFNTMVNAIPQLAWMANADGSIFWYNSRWYEYTGTKPEEMKGWGWQSVHKPSYLPGVLEAWRKALQTGHEFQMEFPLRAADGSYGWFLTLVLPFKDAAGKVVRWFGTNTDLTEKRASEELFRNLNEELERRVTQRTAELEAANKELEAFSYSISHDLRAPLRAIDGFSKAVMEDCGPQLSPHGRADLQKVRKGAQRMGILIDHLLEFSRLSRVPVKRQVISMQSLVRDVIEQLTREETFRLVYISVQELPDMLGDPLLMEQVLLNLVSNALKYSSRQKEAKITIGCRNEDGKNAYFVSDNGAGFDMQYASKLFGVFQRLHRNDEFEGTGVGLATAQRIIQRHGGKIWAESRIDHGATFSFTVSGGRA